jgi:hypothetical protein
MILNYNDTEKQIREMTMSSRMYYSHEAEQRARRERALLVVAFMALGLALGAIVALLFAPESGDRVRHTISDTLQEGAEATREALQRLEKEFGELRRQVDDRLGPS